MTIQDYNLVFCTTNGRPIEGNTINKSFQNLIKTNNLPKVVFHSLRHYSITYKLKLNGGDVKSVQGDSGYAQVKMVTDVYSHILDDDRIVNARRFEDTFYHTKEEVPEEQSSAPEPDVAESGQAMLLRLLQNPEMAAALKALAKNL